MAYNPFPVGYQPQQLYYQPNYQPVQNAPQNQNTGIIWVSGEAGARGYPVAPNTTIQLWDSDENVIYIKSADASGMPSMKILDYVIRENTDKKVGILKSTDFATKDEVSKEIRRLEKMISEASKNISDSGLVE
jgi:hypothetical protein